ncbi:hypothetical protein LN042_33390 [Kitasatospora sp. RB6PN24]|uniref:hypothetical protein n=1 Tax=Kitasatospora humi TaxID=2893891 RepID=UPI001E3D7582|nr:hypothetical protein [Kitasatospora humi]MCC9311901.1 hypothetical protein [Kitasatospora humi]
MQWRWLRADAPVHRREPAELPGFRSLTGYEDVRSGYRDHETFCSAHGPESWPVRLTSHSA